MKYEDALRALDERQEARVELGLERMRAHLERLGRPDRAPAIHVAGTNGKGSVCAILESVYRASGLRTGLYTSPHLVEPRERIAVDGRPIPREAFTRALSRALEADPDKSLTYFELVTSAAFVAFAEAGCELLLLETGLGGRLDATNVIESPLACAVTSIDFDHMAQLGVTLEAIACEKGGIFKPGAPAFAPALASEAARSLERCAYEAKTSLTIVEPRRGSLRNDWENGRQLVGGGPEGAFWLSLMGERQPRNLDLCRAIVNALEPRLRVSTEAWKRGLESARWPGRFDIRPLRGRSLILDGAHNPEAARALAATWACSPFSGDRARWIIGMLADKDVLGVLAELAPVLSEVVAVPAPSPRALAVEELAKLARAAAPQAAVSTAASLDEALAAWTSAALPRTAVVCGSFTLVGQALRALELEELHADR